MQSIVMLLRMGHQVSMVEQSSAGTHVGVEQAIGFPIETELKVKVAGRFVGPLLVGHTDEGVQEILFGVELLCLRLDAPVKRGVGAVAQLVDIFLIPQFLRCLGPTSFQGRDNYCRWCRQLRFGSGSSQALPPV